MARELLNLKDLSIIFIDMWLLTIEKLKQNMYILEEL